MRWPLVILNGTRYDELLQRERDFRRLASITMIVEHVNNTTEMRSRAILFRAPLGDIPHMLSYSSTGPQRMMRLFGLDLGTVMLATGEGYDVLFMEP